MRASFENGRTIDYCSQRSTRKESKTVSHFTYTFQNDVSYAQPGTIEFFLAERYLLFAVNRRKLILVGQVHHTPYPLCNVETQRVQTDLFELNGFPSNQRPFDHVIGSRGVNVEVFALEQCSLRLV